MVGQQVSNPDKNKSEIMALYVLIFRFMDGGVHLQ
jgi:hypothetical protein